MDDVHDVLVDGHVHCHPCFDPDDFFDHASANLGAAAGVDGAAARCLMLTESAGEHVFRDLAARAGNAGPGRWAVLATEEDDSVLVWRAPETRLVVVAGRQIVTRERLEVLSLGSNAEFTPGLSLAGAVSAVADAGGVPVVPWGFGKWWFARGRLVEALLRGPVMPRFFLGDNGGRPRLGPRPALFRRAEAQGIGVLPGSDPLPFPRQVSKVGAYGFVLRGSFSMQRPAASVRQMLAALNRSPEPFGRRETLPGFVRAQVGMQWRTRGGAR